jgi:hypothetical protein
MTPGDERKSPQSEEGPEWRGDESFGGGWGNQIPREPLPGEGGGNEPHGYRDGGDGWYDASPTSNAFRSGEPGESLRADQVEIGPAGCDGPGQLTSPASFGSDIVVPQSLDPAAGGPATSAGNEGRALFERERSAARGPHVLNRSFAGTYPDEE